MIKPYPIEDRPNFNWRNNSYQTATRSNSMPQLQNDWNSIPRKTYYENNQDYKIPKQNEMQPISFNTSNLNPSMIVKNSGNRDPRLNKPPKEADRLKNDTEISSDQSTSSLMCLLTSEKLDGIISSEANVESQCSQIVKNKDFNLENQSTSNLDSSQSKHKQNQTDEFLNENDNFLRQIRAETNEKLLHGSDEVSLYEYC